MLLVLVGPLGEKRQQSSHILVLAKPLKLSPVRIQVHHCVHVKKQH